MAKRSTGAWKMLATSWAMPSFCEAPPVRRMQAGLHADPLAVEAHVEELAFEQGADLDRRAGVIGGEVSEPGRRSRGAG